uniref:Uncharacterized protein n=1 Tax=Otus sunia TaxID=257818 RepID=A0A8C8AGG5_9STRI
IMSLLSGGPYGTFAGRVASRGLATFCLDKDVLRDEYDDLLDLNSVQIHKKYDSVGRFLKPGEEPSVYTDEEASPPRIMTTDDAASAGPRDVRTS